MTRGLAVLPAPVESPEDPGLWRVQECADFLAITRDALYKLVAAGDLPVVRWGRNLRFRPSSVRAWVARKEAGE